MSGTESARGQVRPGLPRTEPAPPAEAQGTAPPANGLRAPRLPAAAVGPKDGGDLFKSDLQTELVPAKSPKSILKVAVVGSVFLKTLTVGLRFPSPGEPLLRDGVPQRRRPHAPHSELSEVRPVQSHVSPGRALLPRGAGGGPGSPRRPQDAPPLRHFRLLALHA